MAKKTATSNKKSTKAPPKKKQPAASTRKPKQTQKTRSAPKPAPENAGGGSGSGLSLDRKLDITGVILALVGLLILLVLISSNHSSGSQDLITYLAILFGWGAYLLPIAMVAVGIWLVLRNFERIPRISIERVTGILLFYGTLLAFFQFLTAPQTLEQGLQTAQQGEGGGLIGAYLYSFL
jgi:DNA segregation ATPase FtsK/SpoIIIE, S-DNA-T family